MDLGIFCLFHFGVFFVLFFVLGFFVLIFAFF